MSQKVHKPERKENIATRLRLGADQCMGKGKYPRGMPPDWRTVGEMAASGTEVRAWCRTCNLVLKVSPAMLAAYHGQDFSLVNRLAKCRQVGCDGTVFFMANGRGRFESLLFD